MSNGIGNNVIGMKMWNREAFVWLKNDLKVCLIK